VARLRQAVQEFEAIFLEQMLKTARQSPLKAGLFSPGAGREIYEGLADQQLAQAVARGGGGLGLGKLLMRSLVPDQQPKPSSPGPTRPIP
jgi:flagellar protein FlgJ